MKHTAFEIKGLYLFTPKLIEDERGYFFESFRESWLQDLGETANFVQENQSQSSFSTLRGLHYQTQQTQGKLIRVLSGEIFDVAVDMRANSPTFGHYQSVYLNASNHESFWVPAGFAHGFMVTSETAQVFYKCTDYYHPNSEISLSWSDPTLNINWPKHHPKISDKDAAGISLEKAPKL